MFILEKYKNQIIINSENNLNNLINFYSNKKPKQNCNYLFVNKNKYIRNFLLYYSIYLTTNPFSFIIFYKNFLSNKNLNNKSLLILDFKYNTIFF